MLYAVTPYGRDGPSSRVRVFEWLDRIPEPVAISSYISHRNASPAAVARRPLAVISAERRLRAMAAARPRTLLLHREASPLSRGALERELLAAADFGVYDFDDALQWDWGEGGRLRRIAPKAPKALAAARTADRVIAGNPVLADWASEHCDDVVVIPSCVAPDRYRRKTDYALADPPRLGWIGTVSSEEYFPSVAPALLEVHRRTGARLTVVGVTRPNLGALERMIDRVAWSEAAQYELPAGFDVGISPVTDTPYERGKSGYKLLQYAAAATPVVASPVGVNAEILAAFDAPAPATVAEWCDALLELLSQPVAERRRLGDRGREVAERQYSFDAWLGRWREAVGLDPGEGEGDGR